MSIYTNPTFFKQTEDAPRDYTEKQLQTIFGANAEVMKITYDEFTQINRRKMDTNELQTTIATFNREPPNEEPLYRFVGATEDFTNNEAMLKIMQGKPIDKKMSRAIFKYICPDKDRMDIKSFDQFIDFFGLNTYNLPVETLFQAISGNKPAITSDDLHTFIAGNKFKIIVSVKLIIYAIFRYTT